MEGMRKPAVQVLTAKDMVPEKNQISPAPNQFTHELTRVEPYYFSGAQQSSSADGEFAPGTKVVLLRYEGGAYCRVSDGRGLYVEISYDGLKRLQM
jgi:hypothetical protein